MDKDEITKILSKVMQLDFGELKKIQGDTSLVELGLESVSFIQFIVAMEEKFGIEIRDSDLLLSNFDTLDKLFSTLEQYFQKEEPIKKVLICDCDNVLWRGVAGEEDITVEKAHLAFQETLINLYDKGVLLCLCSKNQIENILKALETPSMLLKKEHILIAKIGYQDKPSYVKEIAEELNLMIDSFVFVDDSDYEIGLMNAMLPEVTTIKACYSDMKFINEICVFFDIVGSGSERTRQYREQKEREKDKLQYKSIEEYNNSLKTKCYCELADIGEAGRIAELSNRTNQFNLSNMRCTEEEICKLMKSDDYNIISLKVCDKYGDMGIVGAAVVEHGYPIIIRGFFLSCRVFGRGFEDVLVDKIKSIYGDELIGIYLQTEKNKRFSSFYTEHGIGKRPYLI